MTTPTANSAEHHLRPAPGERLVDWVAGAQVEPLGEEDERREGDAEADERDVHGERQRLHLARLEQVVLVDGGRARCKQKRSHPRPRIPRRAPRGNSGPCPIPLLRSPPPRSGRRSRPPAPRLGRLETPRTFAIDGDARRQPASPAPRSYRVDRSSADAARAFQSSGYAGRSSASARNQSSCRRALGRLRDPVRALGDHLLADRGHGLLPRRPASGRRLRLRLRLGGRACRRGLLLLLLPYGSPPLD